MSVPLSGQMAPPHSAAVTSDSGQMAAKSTNQSWRLDDGNSIGSGPTVLVATSFVQCLGDWVMSDESAGAARIIRASDRLVCGVAAGASVDCGVLAACRVSVHDGLTVLSDMGSLPKVYAKRQQTSVVQTAGARPK